jgi:hypothetical protein
MAYNKDVHEFDQHGFMVHKDTKGIVGVEQVPLPIKATDEVSKAEEQKAKVVVKKEESKKEWKEEPKETKKEETTETKRWSK